MSQPYDRDWRRVRLVVLARDGYRCRIRGPRCTDVATTVDHIVELARGGARLDPDNLRAACKPCNSSAGATTGNQLREPRSQRWYWRGQHEPAGRMLDPGNDAPVSSSLNRRCGVLRPRWCPRHGEGTEGRSNKPREAAVSRRSRTVYDHPAWRTVRPAVLARDGHLCQIRGPHCVGVANEVDHIVPLEVGGAPYDPRNLRAACKPCNSGRRPAYASRRW